MAYPKITVNTGLALEIIASDSLPIPSSDLPKKSGQSTGTSAGKLTDTNANFSSVSVNDIIYNTTDKTSAIVTAIDSNTVISVSEDIFVSGDNYTAFLGGPNGSSRINSSEGCLLYVGSNSEIKQNISGSAGGTADPRYVDISVKTTSGADVIFKNFKVGSYLPIQITNLYTTNTTASAQNFCVAVW